MPCQRADYHAEGQRQPDCAKPYGLRPAFEGALMTFVTSRIVAYHLAKFTPALPRCQAHGDRGTALR